jgi:fucose permease
MPTTSFSTPSKGQTDRGPFAIRAALFFMWGFLMVFNDIVSATTSDPIARMGCKNGVIGGLLISAMDSALFWPAAA